jgi:hypothetical protein
MGVNLPKICFGVKPSSCFPLQRIETATNDSRDVMQKAEELPGTSIITCDKGKNCSLFNAGIADFQLNAVSWSSCNTTDTPNGLLDYFYRNEFPYNAWSNANCDVRVFTGRSYARAYMILPDQTSLEVFSKWLHFIGDRTGILTERELAIHEIADAISSLVKSEKTTEGMPPPKRALDLNYLDPYKLWIREGLDLYTTPSQELLDSSDEELTVRFYNWAFEQNEYPLNECIERSRFAFSLQNYKQGQYLNSAYHSPFLNAIVLRPPSIEKLLDDDKRFDDEMLHECLHWEWHMCRVRDEILYLLYEGMALFFEKEHIGRKERQMLDKLLYPIFQGSSGNEIRAYMLANDGKYTIRLLNEIMPFLSDSAVVYLFDWLDEVLEYDQQEIKMVNVENRREFLKTYKDAYLLYRRKLPAAYAKLLSFFTDLLTLFIFIPI